MNYTVIDTGNSRSFSRDHALLAGCRPEGEVVILMGSGAGAALPTVCEQDSRAAILVELDFNCLGVHTGESGGKEGSNVLGFARFRLGSADPSDLVELVRQPATRQNAISAAKSVFEAVGLEVAVCSDFAGRTGSGSLII